MTKLHLLTSVPRTGNFCHVCFSQLYSVNRVSELIEGSTAEALRCHIGLMDGCVGGSVAG